MITTIEYWSKFITISWPPKTNTVQPQVQILTPTLSVDPPQGIDFLVASETTDQID